MELFVPEHFHVRAAGFYDMQPRLVFVHTVHNYLQWTIHFYWQLAFQ